jgi:hypothetical protein
VLLFPYEVILEQDAGVGVPKGDFNGVGCAKVGVELKERKVGDGVGGALLLAAVADIVVAELLFDPASKAHDLEMRKREGEK